MWDLKNKLKDSGIKFRLTRYPKFIDPIYELKDYFHNLSFDIDIIATFDIVNSTILVIHSPFKELADGGRP